VSSPRNGGVRLSEDLKAEEGRNRHELGHVEGDRDRLHRVNLEFLIVEQRPTFPS
jgi:hypothetical protein